MLNYHKLSIPERILLVEEIWDSIAMDSAASKETPLLDWQKIELKKRLEEHRKNPKDGEDWRVVMKRLESEL